MRRYLVFGAISAGLAVAFGAFGAHALSSFVVPERIHTFQTGVQYQMYHSLALLLVGYLAGKNPGKMHRLAGNLFAIGILLFSGSLYVLVLIDMPLFGIVTPFGGIAFLLGWASLALALSRGRP